jgi:SPP1 family predicted phage head-tail adaptor
MEAGNLDRRVQFRRFTLIDDGFAQVESWVDYGSVVWAERRLVSDREQVAAAQVAARITARFLVRWSGLTGAITPKDRLICEGREYDITGVKEIGRREGVEITAAARADQ